MREEIQKRYELAHDLTALAELGLARLAAAQINPLSGLATDFLNPFNEYLMLADMVATGLEDADLLRQWVAPDYRSHFMRSGFAGAGTIIAAYDRLPTKRRQTFESEVDQLVQLIARHQDSSDRRMLPEICRQRDRLAEMITPRLGTLQHHSHESGASQGAIDAMFD